MKKRKYHGKKRIDINQKSFAFTHRYDEGKFTFEKLRSIKDAFNHVYCGMTHNDTCVEDVFHNIKCGLNCHVSNINRIECDKERYSKTSYRP